MAQMKTGKYIVDRRDADGQTKLMTAVSRGMHKETLEIMAEGADIDATDNAGRSVLYHALYSNQQEMAALLLNKGASANPPVAPQNLTPLMVAASGQLHEALEQLINHKADLDVQKQTGGVTALMVAIKFQDNYAAFRLLKAGADAENIRNIDGLNALDMMRLHLPADFPQFKQEVDARRQKHETDRAQEIHENAQDATVLDHAIQPMKRLALKPKSGP